MTRFELTVKASKSTRKAARNYGAITRIFHGFTSYITPDYQVSGRFNRDESTDFYVSVRCPTCLGFLEGISIQVDNFESLSEHTVRVCADEPCSSCLARKRKCEWRDIDVYSGDSD